MTAAQDLKRIAITYGFKPEEWHLRLADETSAMAIIGIFRHAVVQENGLWFHSAELQERARPFLRHVEKVLGRPLDVFAPQLPEAREQSPRTIDEKRRISQGKITALAAWKEQNPKRRNSREAR